MNVLKRLRGNNGRVGKGNIVGRYERNSDGIVVGQTPLPHQSPQLNGGARGKGLVSGTLDIPY